MTFLPKKVIFPQNAPGYRALFWLFCRIIQCVFTPKTPKKLIFPQIATIIQGTLLTFLPKKVIISSKCAFKSSIILTFLPNKPVCFYTKKYQKLNFPLNCDYNTGHLLTFLPKKVIFSSKCACILSTILSFCPIIQCVFTPKIPKKFIFPQISPIIQGTLLTFSEKKDFVLKMRLHIEHYFDFFAQ